MKLEEKTRQLEENSNKHHDDTAAWARKLGKSEGRADALNLQVGRNNRIEEERMSNGRRDGDKKAPGDKAT